MGPTYEGALHKEQRFKIVSGRKLVFCITTVYVYDPLSEFTLKEE